MGFMQKKLDILTRNVEIALCFLFFGKYHVFFGFIEDNMHKNYLCF